MANVQDQHGRGDQFGQAPGPGAVGVAAGEVGQGLGDVGFADSDRWTKADRPRTVESDV